MQVPKINGLLGRILPKAAHYVGGATAGFLSISNPALATLITIVFVVYEFGEWWVIEDKLYPDVKEFLIALTAAGFLELIQRWF